MAAPPRAHRRRTAAVAFILVAAMLVPALALANGRPPLTNGVYFRPGDDQALFVRSTFGLLVSKDGGCTFRWVCEKAIGYGGEFDPKYAIATDGTIEILSCGGTGVFALSRDGVRHMESNGARLGAPAALEIVTEPLALSDGAVLFACTAGVL